MARYELWNTATANLVGDYANEEDALRDVRRDIDRYGRETTKTLALGRADGKGAVLKGAELHKRALERFPEQLSA